MFEPDRPARLRLVHAAAVLLVGGLLIGALAGVLLAVTLRLPAAFEADPVSGGVLAVRALLIGAATGAGAGLIGGIGAVAGMVTARAVSHGEAAFVAGTSVGAAIGLLVATANLLVSRDHTTWTAAALATAVAGIAGAAGGWALTRREHTWERTHRERTPSATPIAR